MNEYVEVAAVAGFSTIGAVIGLLMKHLANEQALTEFEMRRLFLAAGAGLASGLIGQGLYVNKPFIVGSSIIVGYAGGKKFFDWALKLLSILTRRRLERSDTSADNPMKLPALDDEEDKEESG